MRQGYPTTQEAIAGGIAQMSKVKVVGYAESFHDAKLRLEAAGKAMALKSIKEREKWLELRGNLKVEPLTPEQLSSVVYPGRKY
jgi:hypothetical protein